MFPPNNSRILFTALTRTLNIKKKTFLKKIFLFFFFPVNACLNLKWIFFSKLEICFQPPSRPEKIDQKVIDGHVIPHHVLFTSATPQAIDYRTLAFHDMMKVTISFTQQNDGKHSKSKFFKNVEITLKF